MLYKAIKDACMLKLQQRDVGEFAGVAGTRHTSHAYTYTRTRGIEHSKQFCHPMLKKCHIQPENTESLVFMPEARHNTRFLPHFALSMLSPLVLVLEYRVVPHFLSRALYDCVDVE